MTEAVLSVGQVLYEPGSPVTGVYFPSSAVASVVTIMRDGRVVECASVGFESAVGLLPSISDDVSSNRTFVQIAGSAIRIPAKTLRDMAFARPTLMATVVRHAQANTAQSEQSVACNALHDLQPRLCRWLLVCHDRVDSDVMNLTQEYMAVMLGVQRSTVSIAASALREAGVISYSRGQVRLLDRKALERRACECYVAQQESLARLFGHSPTRHSEAI